MTNLSDQTSRPWVEDINLGRADSMNVLRAFQADIQLMDDTCEMLGPIGSITGLAGRVTESVDLWEAADEISADVEPLGHAADAIRKWLAEAEEITIDAVVMVELLRLQPEHRGRRLASAINDQVLELLQFDPDSTLVVLLPEPQKETGGFMPEGPERDAALERLRLAYEKQGFTRWRDSSVWWKV